MSHLLTLDELKAIVSQLQTYDKTFRDIAEDLDVGHATISNINVGSSYRNITSCLDGVDGYPIREGRATKNRFRQWELETIKTHYPYRTSQWIVENTKIERRPHDIRTKANEIGVDKVYRSFGLSAEQMVGVVMTLRFHPEVPMTYISQQVDIDYQNLKKLNDLENYERMSRHLLDLDDDESQIRDVERARLIRKKKRLFDAFKGD